MTADPEYYLSVLDDAGMDSESCTFLVVTDATRELVAEALGADLTRSVTGDEDVDGIDYSAYAFAELRGGVLAYEPTGYADPSNDTLRDLSRGRRVAVARSNIQAHDRFGCARDGELVFDDDEFTFIEDPERVPEELRSLFQKAWVDLDADDEDDAYLSPLFVAMAMAEVFTGLTITAADLARANEAGSHRVRTLTYLG